MSIFEEVGERLQKAFQKGIPRNRKREIERELRKRGANDEQVAYALMLEENQPKANEIWSQTLKLLVKLGFDVYAKASWHENGANLHVVLSPLDKETFDRLTASYRAQEEAAAKMRDNNREATKEEDKTANLIKPGACRDCIEGNDHQPNENCGKHEKTEADNDAEGCDCHEVENQVCDKCQKIDPNNPKKGLV